MESAMTSRETREYFIPSVPIEIPSLTVVVPKSCGIAPASRIEASALRARTSSPALHGVIVLYAFAIPIIGLPKSPSPKPTARSMARFGARCTPSVMALLLSLLGMSQMYGRDGKDGKAEGGILIQSKAKDLLYGREPRNRSVVASLLGARSFFHPLSRLLLPAE